MGFHIDLSSPDDNPHCCEKIKNDDKDQKDLGNNREEFSENFNKAFLA
jgi:hypothetical protein